MIKILSIASYYYFDYQWDDWERKGKNWRIPLRVQIAQMGEKIRPSLPGWRFMHLHVAESELKRKCTFLFHWIGMSRTLRASASQTREEDLTAARRPKCAKEKKKLLKGGVCSLEDGPEAKGHVGGLRVSMKSPAALTTRSTQE